MNKDKSIDGLRPHQSKKAAKLNPATPNLPTAKATRKTSKSTPRASTTKPTTKAKSIKSAKPVAKAAKTTKAPKTSKVTRTARVTNSAAPISTPPEQTDIASSKQAIVDSVNDFLSPTNVFSFDEQSGELQAQTTTSTSDSATTTNSTDNPKPKKAKKPMSKKRKVITSVLLVIVLLLCGAVTWLVFWGNDIIAKITGGQGNVLDLITFIEPTYERLKTDENGRTNILAFGTSGYNMDGDEGNGVHDGAQLTDSIMVISIDQDTGDIVMTSLPRDLKAGPTCTATGKINEVYWCNGGGGDATTETETAAATALMNEVGDILGLEFQYFAHLNWGSLIQIVDILGGIEVTLDEDIYDYYWTGAVFDAGTPYTIDGEQALGLARARHGTTSGDFTRGASQQKILIGIKNKLQEKDLSIPDLVGLASTLGDNLRTNFTIEEMKSLAHMLSEYDLESMRQVSLIEPNPLMTTGTINGISYVLPSGGAGYYTRIQEYIAKMFSSDPRSYEDYSILILNATETPGLASSEKTALEEVGYTNVYVDDAPESQYETGTTLYVINDAAPGTKKLLEEKYGLEAKSLEELPAEISREYNFVLIINEDKTE